MVGTIEQGKLIEEYRDVFRVEDCGPCILGFQDIQRLKVAQMVGTIEQGKLIEEYRDVFRGIGCISCK
ncbi:hypothetical protein QE152_g6737 [Popillia japonica]|uniref:Uncharacterized protein n=1 Tax=Popillia japonica TaxID=7064 RepID=A0AAW1MEB1_POPJA